VHAVAFLCQHTYEAGISTKPKCEPIRLSACNLSLKGFFSSKLRFLNAATECKRTSTQKKTLNTTEDVPAMALNVRK
jgi:hypothetical protein